MTSSSGSTMSRKPRRHPIRHWTGPERKFDLLFEGTVGVLVVSVLVVAASIIFGSANGGLNYPGGPPSKPGDAFTARYWVTSPTTDDHGQTDSNGGAIDFATTVVAELGGTSDTAGYGPPFNETVGSPAIGPVSLTRAAHAVVGLTQPINSANDFVIAPLKQLVAPYRPHGRGRDRRIHRSRRQSRRRRRRRQAGLRSADRLAHGLLRCAGSRNHRQRKDQRGPRRLRTGPRTGAGRSHHRAERLTGRLSPRQSEPDQHQSLQGDDVLRRREGLERSRRRSGACPGTSGAS